MDPFLEHPAVFPGLHDRLITYLGEALQSRLPEPYYAEIGDRLWVEVSQRPIGPDVNVLRREAPRRPAGSSGLAVASKPTSRAVLVTVPHDEMREPFLQIFSRLEGERLVTTIEVLSPSNKTLGSPGRDLYLRKQREILSSQTNLVEIDLLRGGEHTTAVPHDLACKHAGPFDYHVCVHGFEHFEDYLLYPIRLEERLPEIEIPLLPADAPVVVSLQAVFDRAYDTGPYRRRIAYGKELPAPPLGAEREAWAARVIGGS
jgi:hypothetical protein